mmetsp:Transcript_10350/g.10219  ORF Transcript_10350/g.10219 Transcript_10350/m.10219 type:complete len:394 (-) Transcript_10350:904-2085(-)
MATKAQSSNLNEELGQVEYIFSDKTGTLTQNIMEFKKMVIGPVSYGKSESEIPSPEEGKKEEDKNEEDDFIEDLSEPQKTNPEITNVNFYDPKFYEDYRNPHCQNLSMIKRFLLHLALCHTVIIEKKESNGETKMIYNASSPDELALVNAARYFGYFFKERDSENNICLEMEDGSIEQYKLLNVIEFDSTRKRMSVIIRMPSGEIKVLCKGADSIIEQRLRDQINMPETTKYLENYASEGLRTLLLAEKTIDEEEYKEWNKKYEEACISTSNREENIAKIAEKIEWEFELVGATAIEDKLQDEVADTINILKEAGIKIWVLTGDKIETAINIGYSCKVLSNDMDQYIIDNTKTSDIADRLIEVQNEFEQSEARNHGLIVAGDSLLKITSSSDL